MKEYAQILNYAIPFFLILIFIEFIFSYTLNLKINRLFDTISSLSSGITNVVKDVLGLSLIIISYDWLVNSLAIIHIKSTIIVYILAFIGIDFSGYWVHRWCHEINIFWNRHIIHHSSEEYNLSCALRQSVSEIFAIFTFTYIPMAILGVPTQIIAIVTPIHLFAQFWYHTQLIGKLGFLEYFMVTPSHHRVHHAINPKYMDKNYGQILIIWDKLFGTFQVELNNEKPVYGVTRAVKTWNPWFINFQHVWLLLKDAWRTQRWQDKIRIWFMPTGWRPADIMDKYPIEYSKDIYNRSKYETEASDLFKAWSFLQLIITLFLMIYLFNNIGNMSWNYILAYGLFLFITVFAFTSLMDGSVLGVATEFLKAGIGICLIMMNGYSWFNIEALIPFGTVILVIYFIISGLLAVYFYVVDRPVSKVINDYENLRLT
jgi:sterol desaturase/sphingolipid hydroxylase (fatty acid hydroxylase superfamily)